MRKRLPALLLSGVLLLSCAACAPETAEETPVPTTPAPSETAEQTRPQAEEREFVLPCYGEQPFHPITGGNRTNLTLAPLMYEGLYELDQSFTPSPVLCASAQTDETGLIWTFTLREGVTFSDGSLLTASDVVYSLQLAMGENSPYAGRFTGVTGIAAGEGNTVTITLSAPNGALPALLDVPIVKETGGTPLGTGPYVLTGEGDNLALEARTGWWKGEAVPLERIPLYNVREADGMIHAFDTQEISLVTVDITGSNALGYSGTYEVWDYATSVMLYIGYNTASGPCADQDLRRALSYGYERTAVTKSLLSQHARAAALPVSPMSPLYDETLSSSLEYAPQTAEQLLEAAGWSPGADGLRTNGWQNLSLRFIVNTDNTYKVSAAEYLAQGLGKLGITVELEKLPWEDYVAALTAGEFDLYLGEVKLTGDFDLTALIAPEGTLNYGGYSDADAQTLLSAFRAAGEGQREAAASALYARLAETAPFTPICFKNWSVLTHWGSLTGLSPTQQNVFYGLTGWEMG